MPGSASRSSYADGTVAAVPLDDGGGRGVQPQRPARVAEPAPGPDRLPGGLGGQRGRCRPAAQPLLVDGQDPRHRRLLEHELRDQHRPRGRPTARATGSSRACSSYQPSSGRVEVGHRGHCPRRVFPVTGVTRRGSTARARLLPTVAPCRRRRVDLCLPTCTDDAVSWSSRSPCCWCWASAGCSAGRATGRAAVASRPPRSAPTPRRRPTRAQEGQGEGQEGRQGQRQGEGQGRQVADADPVTDPAGRRPAVRAPTRTCSSRRRCPTPWPGGT